ncbi:MAG: DoxX family membrane protein [Candidatus Hydrothermarchaeota archaeon]
MDTRKFSIGIFSLLLGLAAFAATGYAHVRYVLTPEEVQKAETAAKPVLFAGLSGLNLPYVIGTVLAILITIYLAVRLRGNKSLERPGEMLAPLVGYTPLILRLFIGTLLIFAGATGTLFGPELHLAGINSALATVIANLEVVAGIFILFGHLIKVGALAIVLLWLLGLGTFGIGLFDHFDIIGIALYFLLAGCGPYAYDNLIIPTLHAKMRFLKALEDRIQAYRGMEVAFVRVALGLTLIWLGLTEKIIEPQLALAVVEKYTLPAMPSPELFVLAAGLTEIGIGVLLIAGAFTRLVIFVTTVFVLLGVLAFKEQVIGHLDFVSIALTLLINGSGPYRVEDLFARRE